MVAEFNNNAVKIDAPLSARNELISFRTVEDRKLEAEIIQGVQYIPKQQISNQPVLDLIQDTHHITNYLKTRDNLIGLKSKKEIISHALEIVCKELKCQVAAIFLYSKDGTLARVGIKGIDKFGNSIDDEWFDKENYHVGASFTGRAASPSDNSKYGKAQVADDFSQEDLKNHEEYLAKLGRLDCAIAVPLNGRNMTYGVLRIINRVDSDTTGFSQDNVHLVSFFAGAIAAAISNFRRDTQNSILRYLKDSLIISEKNNFDYTDFLKKVFGFLVGSETAFNAAILRIKSNSYESLEEVEPFYAVSDSIKKTDLENKIIGLDTQFISSVIQYFKSHIIKNDSEKDIPNEFISPEWIEKNKLGSCGCFPLIHPHKKEIIGTITLFAGYEYEFHSGIIDFLNNIISTITVIILREKKRKERESKFLKLAQQWFDETGYLSSTTEAVLHPAYQQIIGMGEDAIPLLLKELLKPSGRWFWALKAITGEDPVHREHRGKTQKMTQDWIAWGVEKGYISLDEIESLMYE